MADNRDTTVVRCAYCGRRLYEAISRLLGIGPHCAKENGVEHSIRQASAKSNTEGKAP